MNTLPPKSYDAWLAMDDAEQEHIKNNIWNAYSRDRIDIPFMALSRLMASSDRTIIDGAIGTYHCGEYLLHVYVPQDEIDDCPKPLKQRFEGFRVYWMYYSEERPFLDKLNVRGLELDVLGSSVTVNARWVDLRVYVDAFDANGKPLLVTHPSVHDGCIGFSFALPDFHPHTVGPHVLLCYEDGTWRHEYTVSKSVAHPKSV